MLYQQHGNRKKENKSTGQDQSTPYHPHFLIRPGTCFRQNKCAGHVSSETSANRSRVILGIDHRTMEVCNLGRTNVLDEGWDIGEQAMVV